MTQETPAKVFSLLGVAMFSMFFLFAVTVSNASFDKVYNPIPDSLSMQNLGGNIDNFASGYSNFLYANLINPAQQDYAFVSDNLSFIGAEAGPQLLKYAGLEGVSGIIARSAQQPQVLGASTIHVESPLYYSSAQGFNVDTLYGMLFQQ